MKKSLSCSLIVMALSCLALSIQAEDFDPYDHPNDVTYKDGYILAGSLCDSAHKRYKELTEKYGFFCSPKEFAQLGVEQTKEYSRYCEEESNPKHLSEWLENRWGNYKNIYPTAFTTQQEFQKYKFEVAVAWGLHDKRIKKKTFSEWLKYYIERQNRLEQDWQEYNDHNPDVMTKSEWQVIQNSDDRDAWALYCDWFKAGNKQKTLDVNAWLAIKKQYDDVFKEYDLTVPAEKQVLWLEFNEHSPAALGTQEFFDECGCLLKAWRFYCNSCSCKWLQRTNFEVWRDARMLFSKIVQRYTVDNCENFDKSFISQALDETTLWKEINSVHPELLEQKDVLSEELEEIVCLWGAYCARLMDPEESSFEPLGFDDWLYTRKQFYTELSLYGKKDIQELWRDINILDPQILGKENFLLECHDAFKEWSTYKNTFKDAIAFDDWLMLEQNVRVAREKYCEYCNAHEKAKTDFVQWLKTYKEWHKLLQTIPLSLDEEYTTKKFSSESLSAYEDYCKKYPDTEVKDWIIVSKRLWNKYGAAKKQAKKSGQLIQDFDSWIEHEFEDYASRTSHIDFQLARKQELKNWKKLIARYPQADFSIKELEKLRKHIVGLSADNNFENWIEAFFSYKDNQKILDELLQKSIDKSNQARKRHSKLLATLRFKKIMFDKSHAIAVLISRKETKSNIIALTEAVRDYFKTLEDRELSQKQHACFTLGILKSLICGYLDKEFKEHMVNYLYTYNDFDLDQVFSVQGYVANCFNKKLFTCRDYDRLMEKKEILSYKFSQSPASDFELARMAIRQKMEE